MKPYKSNHIAAIFFDVDDTLYDHLQPLQTALRGWVKEEGGFPYEEAYRRFRYYSDKLSHEMGGAEAMEAANSTELMRRKRFQLTLAEFGIALSEKEAEAAQNAYLACQYDIALYEGAAALLDRIADSGIVLGIMTNGAPDHQRRKIDALRLERWVPPQLQIISGSLGWDKPDKRLFEHACRLADAVPDACVYIGDSWRNDVVGAAEAGWSPIWFNARQAPPESDHHPRHIVSGYEELDELLQRRYGI